MRKPAWLKMRLASGPEFERVNRVVRSHRLHTVCTGARCPNMADCWGRSTATFLILGDTCTRNCRFCSVATDNPHGALDETEPQRVAAAVEELGLSYVVLTSVDRDDLPDFGAGLFADTIRYIKNKVPAVQGVEVLVPDFGGRDEHIRTVLDAGPDVFGHNLETVARLAPLVRDHRASYQRSLDVLQRARRLAPKMTTKSGLMVGLGESPDEVRQAFLDLRRDGCDIVTVGQYLQPDKRCLEVSRFYTPEEFAALEAMARDAGFRQALCGPMVRSSFNAAELAAAGSR
jgi:lipoyl synthase